MATIWSPARLADGPLEARWPLRWIGRSSECAAVAVIDGAERSRAATGRLDRCLLRFGSGRNGQHHYPREPKE